MTTTHTPASGAADLRTAAQAVVDRWDTPLWKDVPATAEYIGRLRAALAAGQATAAQAGVPAGWKLVPLDATDEMVRATDEVNFENGDTDGTIHNVWHVMIAAAPAQPAAQQGAAYAAQQASTVTNYTTLGAAMRAIRQSIQMIGDPEDECMRAVKRVLRGAVIIVEDSGDEVAAPAAPAQPAAEASRFGSPELQAMIIARCVEKDRAGSGFDYKTAADFLSGKTVSDDALRKFVAESRGAHDARAALHVKMLLLQGELASREAEITLLKRSLLDAEAAPQPPTAQADSVQEDAARYRFLRDGEWRDTDLEPFIRLQLNTLWDAKIDAARKQGAPRWQPAVRALTLHI